MSDAPRARSSVAAIAHDVLSWRSPAFLAGVLIGAATILTPVDEAGKDNFVTAHVIQHVALADLAAPLLLLGLPSPLQLRLGTLLDRLGRPRSRAARFTAFALSPVGAIALWAGTTYLWYVPPLHRLAMTGGPVHVLDHLSFLVFGGLIWLAAFDPRAGRTLPAALWSGALPWWARHIYAMTTRVIVLPLGFIVWLSGPSTYHVGEGPPPFGISRPGDLERAGAVLIGFEMLLFGLAVVLAFVFVSVSEDRARRRRPETVPPPDAQTDQQGLE